MTSGTLPDEQHRARNTCEDAPNAHFEAGHAVIAWLEGLEVEQVSIEKEGDADSWIDVREPDLCPTRLRASNEARASAKSVIRGLLAGPAAQGRYSFGACAADFDLTDRHMIDQSAIWRAVSLAGSFPDDGPALIPPLWREVTKTIQTPKVWAAIEAVAAALLRDRELAGCEVEEIAQHAMRVFG
jgi:hypothetical protein